MIRFDGRIADVFAEGRSTAPAAVDQPLLTAGSWVRPGGVVIERTFADALGVSVGDRVDLERQVVHRRRHRGDRRAGALSEPVQRHVAGEHPSGVEVLERLPAVVQHPISLAPGTQGAQQF